MRTKNLAFLCCAVAGIAVLATPAAMATGFSCSSLNYSFTVVSGPCLVQDPQNPVCSAEGDYTGIEYQLSGSHADHVFILVTSNNVVKTPPAVQIFPPGAGCSTTGLGKDVQHERCVKVNPDASTRRFWLVVEGKKTVLQTTIAAKKGSCLKSFQIAGFGQDTNAFAAVQPKEVVAFKKCKVEFEKDPVTNAVVSAALTADSAPNCRLHEATVGEMTLSVPGVGDVGEPKFGDGYVSSGTNSCITRIIGGRVYTWGDPCPE